MAVVEGLKTGVIDAIVSDHRPQDQDSKRVPFAQAEPGGIGLETLLPISLELVHNGHLTLPQLFQRLSSAPARLFGLPGGKLAKGAPADLVLFDADYAWKIDRDRVLEQDQELAVRRAARCRARSWRPSSAAARSTVTIISRRLPRPPEAAAGGA